MDKVDSKENKKISSHNYYLVLIVSVVIVAVTLYVRAFYLNYQSSKVNKSVFSDITIKEINLEDLDFTLNETSNAILYISYTGSKEIYNMEKKLYKEIKNKNLLDNVIYLNIKDTDDASLYMDSLKKEFPNIKNEITNFPMFICINDGEGKAAISSELKIVDYKAFDRLIKECEIE